MSDYQVQIDVEYLGGLHCSVRHSLSGQTFTTDAPLDNNGKGDHISPTDLLAASIGSCIATIMGIKAKANNISIEGLKIKVVKEMVNEPYRRVGKLVIDITFPHRLEDKEFAIMSNVVKTCPVTRSLHPDIVIEHKFSFGE